MRFENPSPTLEKKINVDGRDVPAPNIVKITNRALDESLEEGTKFEIPAEKFVYPQVDSWEEFVQICGTEDRAKEVINTHLRDDALTEAKNKIRLASSGSQDDIVEAGIAAGKNFTYVETEKITAAKAKEVFSELRNIATSKPMDDAEFAALARKMLGL